MAALFRSRFPSWHSTLEAAGSLQGSIGGGGSHFGGALLLCELLLSPVLMRGACGARLSKMGGRRLTT